MAHIDFQHAAFSGELSARDIPLRPLFGVDCSRTLPLLAKGARKLCRLIINTC
ncbi:hypothetical protein SF123566_9468 [Shigella flexneri 1235-66]|nr:hypothetical protein SF123566_9468 [Shigella flexneri 1235-66]